MKLFKFLHKNPLWKHKNPNVRLEAVKQLIDVEILKSIALTDKDFSVQVAAINRINDQSVLFALVTSDLEDERIKIEAINKITDKRLLLDLLKSDIIAMLKKHILSHNYIYNYRVLFEIFTSNYDENVRLMALDFIINDKKIQNYIIADKSINYFDYLKHVAKSEESTQIRMIALQNIKNIDFLISLKENETDLQSKQFIDYLIKERIEKLQNHISNITSIDQLEKFLESSSTPVIKEFALDRKSFLIKNELIILEKELNKINNVNKLDNLLNSEIKEERRVLIKNRIEFLFQQKVDEITNIKELKNLIKYDDNPIIIKVAKKRIEELRQEKTSKKIAWEIHDVIETNATLRVKCIICGCLMKSSEPLLPDRMIVFGSQVPSLTYALECANGHDYLMYSLSSSYYYTTSSQVVKKCRSLSHNLKKDRSSGLWIISEYPDYSLALDFKKWWQFWK